MRKKQIEGFYRELRTNYSEDKIKAFDDLVEKIELEDIKTKDTKKLLKKMKLREVQVCLGIAACNDYAKATAVIGFLYNDLIKEELIKLRNAIRCNTIKSYVKNFDNDDFLFLEKIVFEDYNYLTEEQKELYINELRYLNGEIETAIPKVKVRKKVLPQLEDE